MTMPPTQTDEDFLAAFLSAQLAAADFDHRGHLRAAWLLLQRYPAEVAIERCCSGIAALAARFGAAEKFHRTITEALVRLMAAGGAAALSWPAFEQANAPLFSDARALLARHYSPALLASSEARQRFLPADLLPLPACTTAPTLT
jgi:hypothetical protein